MTDETRYWNECYTDWKHQKQWQYDQPSQELVSAVACGVIPEQGSCLDLGCGTGVEAMYLATRGRQVSAIDWSPVAIEMARAPAMT